MTIDEANLKLYEMQSLAYLMGGRCLSKEYVHEKSSLQWQCMYGHTWDASYSIIRQGGWCMQCAKHENYFLKMAAYAKKYGGKLLSIEYEKSDTKYQWQCQNGHVWHQTFNNLKTAVWCKECKAEKVKKYFLERIRKKVEKNNGKLLSEKYTNSCGHLRLQCKEGHQWSSSAQNILSGYWCKECAGSNKLSIEVFQKIAVAKGGRCLSTTYINKDIKLTFQCGKGHQWSATPRNIKAGTWCAQCRKKSPDDINWRQVMKLAKVEFFKQHTQIDPITLAKNGGIKLANFLAGKRGGKCLTKVYKHMRTKMEWQCRKKHKWFAPLEMISAGNWCPACSGKKKHSILYMQELAKMKNGFCLSKEYHSIAKALLWQCEKGHQWYATPAHILKGSWCTSCNGGKRLTIEYMQHLAKKNKGSCLSKIYINKESKLEWECKEGHRWHSTYANIYKGSWCPECGIAKGAANKKRTQANLKILM